MLIEPWSMDSGGVGAAGAIAAGCVEWAWLTQKDSVTLQGMYTITFLLVT